MKNIGGLLLLNIFISIGNLNETWRLYLCVYLYALFQFYKAVLAKVNDQCFTTILLMISQENLKWLFDQDYV